MPIHARLSPSTFRQLLIKCFQRHSHTASVQLPWVHISSATWTRTPLRQLKLLRPRNGRAVQLTQPPCGHRRAALGLLREYRRMSQDARPSHFGYPLPYAIILRLFRHSSLSFSVSGCPKVPPCFWFFPIPCPVRRRLLTSGVV